MNAPTSHSRSRGRRLRLVLVPLLAAFLGAAVLLVVIHAHRGPASTSPPPSPSTPPASSASSATQGLHVAGPVELEVTIGPVPGLEVRTVEWTRDRQQQIAYSDGSSVHAAVLVTTFGPGTGQPQQVSDAETVDVDGTPATLGAQHAGATTQWHLNLPYAPNRWAVLTTQTSDDQQPDLVPQAKQDLVAVARALQPAASAATVPFTLGWLPPSPTDVSVVRLSNGPRPEGQVLMAAATPSLPVDGSGIGAGPTDGVTVRRYALDPPDSTDTYPVRVPTLDDVTSAEQTTIDGHPVIIGVVRGDPQNPRHVDGALTLVADLGDGTVFAITASPAFSDAYDRPVLRRILQHATFGPVLTESATWVSADQALP